MAFGKNLNHMPPLGATTFGLCWVFQSAPLVFRNRVPFLQPNPETGQELIMEFVILSPGGEESEELDQISKKSINLTPFEKGITQAIISQKQQTNNRASTAITQWIKSTYTFQVN